MYTLLTLVPVPPAPYPTATVAEYALPVAIDDPIRVAFGWEAEVPVPVVYPIAVLSELTVPLIIHWNPIVAIPVPVVLLKEELSPNAVFPDAVLFSSTCVPTPVQSFAVTPPDIDWYPIAVLRVPVVF